MEGLYNIVSTEEEANGNVDRKGKKSQGLLWI